MKFVAGIDPGLSGAIAVYEVESKKLVVLTDIPTVTVEIGRYKRKRLDMAKLREELTILHTLYGLAMIGLERVQGYGGQNAAAAFTFGEVYGRIAAICEDLAPVYSTTPASWKTKNKIPLDAEAIVVKAELEFPNAAASFRGAKNGPLHDRAEAAFLARHVALVALPLAEATVAAPVDMGVDTADEVDAIPNPDKPARQPRVAKSKRAPRRGKKS